MTPRVHQFKGDFLLSLPLPVWPGEADNVICICICVCFHQLSFPPVLLSLCWLVVNIDPTRETATAEALEGRRKAAISKTSESFHCPILTPIRIKLVCSLGGKWHYSSQVLLPTFVHQPFPSSPSIDIHDQVSPEEMEISQATTDMSRWYDDAYVMKRRPTFPSGQISFHFKSPAFLFHTGMKGLKDEWWWN